MPKEAPSLYVDSMKDLQGDNTCTNLIKNLVLYPWLLTLHRSKEHLR